MVTEQGVDYDVMLAGYRDDTLRVVDILEEDWVDSAAVD